MDGQFFPGQAIQFEGDRTPFLGLNFFASANSGTTNATVTLPASILRGDLIILGLYEGGADTISVPTGFSVISAINTTYSDGLMAYKIADGTEGGTTLTVFSGTNAANCKIALVFRPQGAAPPFCLLARPAGKQNTTANPTSQSIAGAAITKPYLHLAMYAATGVVSPRTSGLTMSEVAGASTNHYMKYLICNLADTAANNSADMDDEGTNVLMSCVLAFLPGASYYSADDLAAKGFAFDGASYVDNGDYVTVTGDADGGNFRITTIPVLTGSTHICARVRGNTVVSADLRLDYGDGSETNINTQMKAGQWCLACVTVTAGVGGHLDFTAIYSTGTLDISDVLVYQ